MKFGYLAGHLPGKFLVVAGVCAGLIAVSVPASADSFNVQYFAVSTGTTTGSDFYNGGVDTNTMSNNYVQSTLSGGLPVYNPSYTAAAGYDLPAAANDVSGSGNLQWWSPGTTAGGFNVVTSTGSGVLNLSPTPTNMFPPNSTGSSNQNGLQETAILTGYFTLTSPQSVSFTVGADDDAFVYIDGVLVASEGGIHPVTFMPTVSDSLGSGTHEIQIFYADQDVVAASLAFNDNGIPVSATPEPGSLALLGTGVLGIAGTLRRRFTR